MPGPPFDEALFFRSILQSGARALLLGRRAMAALGVDVAADVYELWVHGDDLAWFNFAVESGGLQPDVLPAEARAAGRYHLGGAAQANVLVAPVAVNGDGVELRFADLWARRRPVEVAPGAMLAVPSLDDLIATRRFLDRPEDREDVRRLEALRPGR